MHVDLGYVSQLTVASWRHMGTHISVDGGSDNARQPQPITWTNVDFFIDYAVFKREQF